MIWNLPNSSDLAAYPVIPLVVVLFLFGARHPAALPTQSPG